MAIHNIDFVKHYYLRFFQTIIISFLSYGFIYSQNSTYLSIGIADYYSKDEIVSNSIFQGFTTKFALTHVRNEKHQFYFHHLFGDLYSDKKNQWEIFSTQLTYNFLPLINQVSSNSHSTGISFSVKGMWINSTFINGNTIKIGRKSGFLNSSFSFTHISEVSLTKNVFSEIRIRLPLLYYTLRPGYSTLDPDRTIGEGATAFNVARSGQFRSLLNQPSFQIGTDFFFRVKQNFFLKMGYQYHFLKINFPKEFSSIDQSFNFGIKWSILKK